MITEEEKVLIRSLLLAALADNSELALCNWMKWKSLRTEANDYSYNELRLLPVAWFRHRKKAPQEKEDIIFQGWFKKTHFQNTLLLHQIGEIVDVLSEKQIPYIFIKGIPLLVREYPKRGMRPTSDMDILIPKTFCREALSAMFQAGWRQPTVLTDTVLDGYLRVNRLKGLNLSKPGRKSVDLHWKAINWQYPENMDSCYFHNKVVLEWQGQPFNAVCPEDLFFHLLANHGVFNNGKIMPWILDIWFLTRNHSINPQRILEKAQATDTIGVLRNQLMLVQEILPEFNQDYLDLFKLVPINPLQEEKNRAMKKAGIESSLLTKAIIMNRAHLSLFSFRNYPYYLLYFIQQFWFNRKDISGYLKRRLQVFYSRIEKEKSHAIR